MHLYFVQFCDIISAHGLDIKPEKEQPRNNDAFATHDIELSGMHYIYAMSA